MDPKIKIELTKESTAIEIAGKRTEILTILNVAFDKNSSFFDLVSDSVDLYKKFRPLINKQNLN